MSYSPDPAFRSLFHTFTSDSQSVGAHLTQRMNEQRAHDPMLVTTGADIALFLGQGRPVVIESFRKSTRGFIELTAISHLPLALAFLIRTHEVAPQSNTWRLDAQRMIKDAEAVRARNSVAYWRDVVAVGSFRGQEEHVAKMVDYVCATTIEYMQRMLLDPRLLSFAVLRSEYLEEGPQCQVKVPLNDTMFATFALAFTDIIVRITHWLRSEAIDWSRLMVMITGRSGRPTAGLTWGTNNMCHLLWSASLGQMHQDQVYIAPHAPSFDAGIAAEPEKLAALELQYRHLWLNTRASVDIAQRMFPDSAIQLPTLRMSEMPELKSVHDRESMAARLRRIMEDPTQLLSNCVADILIDQLRANGNRPQDLEIPGFTHIDYPPLS